MNCAFDSLCKNSLPNTRSLRFSPVLSSRSFIVLWFISDLLYIWPYFCERCKIIWIISLSLFFYFGVWMSSYCSTFKFTFYLLLYLLIFIVSNQHFQTEKHTKCLCLKVFSPYIYMYIHTYICLFFPILVIFMIK